MWRHQQDFAKWITTLTDPVTLTTIPNTLMYSYQIAADDLCMPG